MNWISWMAAGEVCRPSLAWLRFSAWDVIHEVAFCWETSNYCSCKDWCWAITSQWNAQVCHCLMISAAEKSEGRSVCSISLSLSHPTVPIPCVLLWSRTPKCWAQSLGRFIAQETHEEDLSVPIFQISSCSTSFRYTCTLCQEYIPVDSSTHFTSTNTPRVWTTLGKNSWKSFMYNKKLIFSALLFSLQQKPKLFVLLYCLFVCLFVCLGGCCWHWLAVGDRLQ